MTYNLKKPVTKISRSYQGHNPNPHVKITPLFDDAYLRNGTRYTVTMG